MRNFYTITRRDVGSHLIEAFGRKWLAQNFIGRIMPCDVGKRVYVVAPNVLQVENDDQLRKRLNPKRGNSDHE